MAGLKKENHTTSMDGEKQQGDGSPTWLATKPGVRPPKKQIVRSTKKSPIDIMFLFMRKITKEIIKNIIPEDFMINLSINNAVTNLIDNYLAYIFNQILNYISPSLKQFVTEYLRSRKIANSGSRKALPRKVLLLISISLIGFFLALIFLPFRIFLLILFSPIILYILFRVLKYARQLRAVRSANPGTEELLTICPTCEQYDHQLQAGLNEEFSSLGISIECNIIRSAKRQYGPCCGSDDVTGRRKRIAYVIYNGYSVDKTHVDENGADGFTQIRFLTEIVPNLSDPFLKKAFVQNSNLMWMFLSGQICEEIFAQTILGSKVNLENESDYSLCVRADIDGTRGLRTFDIDLQFSVQYNGWPNAANQWTSRAAKTFPEDVVGNIVNNGCQLISKACNDMTCLNHFLDWQFSFTRADDILFAYHHDKTVLLSTYKITEYLLVHNMSATSHLTIPIKDGLKTLTLVMAEENSWFSNILTFANIAVVFVQLLTRFLQSLKKRKLQHYFIPSINLLDGISDREAHILSKVIRSLSSCPEKSLNICLRS